MTYCVFLGHGTDEQSETVTEAGRAREGHLSRQGRTEPAAMHTADYLDTADVASLYTKEASRSTQSPGQGLGM